MEIVLRDWLDLLFRWAHIVAAIGWIGTSFYFMAIDSALRARTGLPRGVAGETWEVHGGGFYHTRKFLVAPEQLPADLIWYRWESYLTWLSGFCLMIIVYYWGAESYLIDRLVADLTAKEAIAISVGSLVAGWVLYDQLCKSPLRHQPVLVFLVLFISIVFLAWAFGKLFTARAAWLHVGAIIATMMTGNVFFVIIPNSRIVVDDLRNGREPDARFGKIAKLRSTHNNYLTLPVILMMISNHFPIAFGHPYHWVLIAAILVIGATVRIWFNLHEAGIHGPVTHWQWPLVIALTFGSIWFSAWRPDLEDADANVGEATLIISEHCSSCHSSKPAHPDYEAAPGGATFDTLAEIQSYASEILSQSVLSTAMPLGNETGMTERERAILGSWLRAGAPSE